MILGIGTDIIEIERIKTSVSNEKFLKKIYTEKEIAMFNGKNFNTMAGNFAAKEAVAKAFGTGFRGFTPNEIEVLRDELGKPVINLYGNAKILCEKKNIVNINVSISHSKEYAIAYVIFE